MFPTTKSVTVSRKKEEIAELQQKQKQIEEQLEKLATEMEKDMIYEETVFREMEKDMMDSFVKMKTTSAFSSDKMTYGTCVLRRSCEDVDKLEVFKTGVKYYFSDFEWSKLYSLYCDYTRHIEDSHLSTASVIPRGGGPETPTYPRIEQEERWRKEVEHFLWEHHCTACKTFSHPICTCEKARHLPEYRTYYGDRRKAGHIPVKMIDTMWCRYCKGFGHGISSCQKIKAQYCTVCIQFGHTAQRHFSKKPIF